MSILPIDFYQRNNPIRIAKELLGKSLVTRINDKLTSGIIVETEAYKAPDDKASHAYGMRKTSRTETMFVEGGKAYIYLCYGIHHLFNVVSGPKDVPHAILIRAIEPKLGISTMLKRRSMFKTEKRLTNGPGILSQALGITRHLNTIDLTKKKSIWIEEIGLHYNPKQLIASPRVNIGYAEEFIEKPWRFRVKDSEWTSKAK